ncbi:MAG TPA: NosD domain-containing protein [Gemmatimonadales bacterium]|nr:NosD domain-containing protein [Gemmatimonadales bacterium]
MTLILSLALTLIAGAAPVEGAAPCLRPSRAGTQVQGEVRVCPGRYRIADPTERGVIVAAASGTRIDLTGVVLESGDSVPSRFTGIGITSKDVDRVSVLGGTIRGYRIGLRLEGGAGHEVRGTNLSGSRTTPLRSAARADTADRLNPFRLAPFIEAGAGLVLVRTTDVSVTGVIAKEAQNGIGLIDARGSYLADNEIRGNTGWGISLWRSSRNVVIRNQLQRTVRCAPPTVDCNTAAILLREGSDSNTITENDLSGSSTGVRISGQSPLTRASVGNLVLRNDASGSGVAFAAGHTWNVTFLENRGDSAAIGFRLDHLNGSVVRGNTVIGSRIVGITLEHSSDNTIEANVLLGGRVGIMVTAPDRGGEPSRGQRIDDNVVGGVEQGILLQGTTGSRVRGNMLDGLVDGLVIDNVGHGTEVTGNVFLRATGWFIDAPDLAAGGNYWATADAAAASARVRGRVSVLPWRPASAAGY